MNKQFKVTDTVCVFGNKEDAIQAMLDYDYVCKKDKPSLITIIDPDVKKKIYYPYFFGSQEILIPAFPSLEVALIDYNPTIFVNFASSRSAFAITKQAIDAPCIEKAVIITEGVPERDSRLLKQYARQKNTYIIGPATVGGLIARVIKIGNAGGTIENIVDNKLYQRGNVGIVSKSGGLLNELMTIVSKNSNGVCEAITTGGDRYPITSLSDQILRFEENLDIKLIVMMGEVGGIQENEVAKLIEQGKLTKPIIAWISGSSAKLLKGNMQFGHAGAMANTDEEVTEVKVAHLKKFGVIFPESFSKLGSCIHEQSVLLGIDTMKDDREKHEEIIPDFGSLLQAGKIRVKRNMISSIAKKDGKDESYVGRSITEAAEKSSIGYIIGLLWFKKEFPESVCSLFELFIKLSADHGAAVSSAHNTIVAARAGRDLVSSLVSGLLTIGPRHGGAVNDAAIYFKTGNDNALSAYDFVQDMKQKGILIPGIGHKVKSITNPDKRVLLLKSYGQEKLSFHNYLDYAIEIEKITTRKKESLILNVDGAMAALLLDVLSAYYTSEQIDELLQMEAFNAFFVLSRSIGLIGHFIDQKRLNQPLYRHPEWDILELD